MFAVQQWQVQQSGVVVRRMGSGARLTGLNSGSVNNKPYALGQVI